jgi:hypothetical protein
MVEEPSELTAVADVVLGRKDPPGSLASRAGITWNAYLQKEWDSRFSRCSGCGVWIRGRRAVWCDVCKIKGM